MSVNITIQQSGRTVIAVSNPSSQANITISNVSVGNGESFDPVNEIAFTTAIPFDYLITRIAEQTVSGALTFTVNSTGQMTGYGAILRLTADGVNEPDFSAFRLTDNSDYDNEAGRTYELVFLYDGYDHILNIVKLAAEVVTLTAPGSFTATAASATQINLTWTDTNTTPNEENFEIQRATLADFSNATTINSPVANATSYNNTSLTPSTQYYYRIRAVGDGILTLTSAWSTDDATTSALVQLSTPGSFTATADGSSEVDLTWTDVANESNYEIQRALQSDYSDAATINSPAAGATSYSDTGRDSETTYYYRIRAKGDNLTYSDSNWATANATTEETEGATLAGTLWSRWYDPSLDAFSEDTTPVTDGSVIEYLYNQMDTGGGARPNSLDLGQNTMGTRPTWHLTSPINNRPAILITSGKTLTSTWGPLTIAKPLTRIMVCRFTSLPAAVSYVGIGPSSSERIGHNGNTPRKFILFGGTTLVNGSITPVADTNYILWAEFNADGTASLYVWGGGNNGVKDINNASTGGSGIPMNGFNVGHTANGASAYVTDMLVYPGIFSAEDRASLAAELATLNDVDVTP